MGATESGVSNKPTNIYRVNAMTENICGYGFLRLTKYLEKTG